VASITDSFSREARVKTNQNNAVQQGAGRGEGLWGGPTVFVCVSASFGRVTWCRAELTDVAKCILLPSEMVKW
jgi:hypothetical protein